MASEQYQNHTSDPMIFMHHFMGFFLTVYSMFKMVLSPPSRLASGLHLQMTTKC